MVLFGFLFVLSDFLGEQIKNSSCSEKFRPNDLLNCDNFEKVAS